MSSRLLRAAGLSLASAPILFASLQLAGCVPDKATVADPPAACTKIGDPCTFSPGKLGLCVESASGGPTLICQSQH
jgi:hypothetical protein